MKYGSDLWLTQLTRKSSRFYIENINKQGFADFWYICMDLQNCRTKSFRGNLWKNLLFAKTTAFFVGTVFFDLPRPLFSLSFCQKTFFLTIQWVAQSIKNGKLFFFVFEQLPCPKFWKKCIWGPKTVFQNLAKNLVENVAKKIRYSK